MMRSLYCLFAIFILLAGCCEQKDLSACVDCPRGTTCINDQCMCQEPNDILINGQWCLQKGSFLAAFDDWHCMDTTFLRFNNLDTAGYLPSPGIGNGSITIGSSFSRGAQTSITYFPMPGGDSIAVYNAHKGAMFLCPQLVQANCSVFLGGRFIHPDTLDATLRIQCMQDKPENGDVLRVKFIRIK